MFEANGYRSGACLGVVLGGTAAEEDRVSTLPAFIQDQAYVDDLIIDR